MASKNFSGTLDLPLGSKAARMKWRFTHQKTTGDVIAASPETTELTETGQYNFDLKFGQILIESKLPSQQNWFSHGSVVIDENTAISTLPELLTAISPAAEDVILQMQAILQDARDAEASSLESSIEAQDLLNETQVLISSFQIVEEIKKKATLSLDFTKNEHKTYEALGLESKPLADILTTWRATAGAYQSPFGLRVAEPNEPRVTYDEATGSPLGLLSEEQRTNLLLWSEDFSQGVWQLFGTSAKIDKHGDNAYKISAESSFNASTIEARQSGFAISTGSVTAFALVKPLGEINGIGFFTSSQRKTGFAPLFDFRDSSVSNGDGKITALQDGWYKCEFYADASSAGGEFFGVRAAKNGSLLFNATAGEELFLISSAQYEQGKLPTSYIKTEGSQVTRSSDNCLLESELNPGEGTFFVDAASFGNSGFSKILGAGSGDSEELQMGYSSAAGDEFGLTLRADSIDKQIVTTLKKGERAKCAVSYSRISSGEFLFKFFFNSSLIGQDTLPDLPSGFLSSGISLGKRRPNSNSLYWNSTISHFSYTPNALSDEELKELTK